MAKRLKIWGYMIRQNKDKTISEFVKNANFPFVHSFNNHEYCSSDWCNTLKANAEGKIYTHPDGFCDRRTNNGKNVRIGFFYHKKIWK